MISIYYSRDISILELVIYFPYLLNSKGWVRHCRRVDQTNPSLQCHCHWQTKYCPSANTRLKCALVVWFVVSDYQRDPRSRLSWWLTIGVSWVVRHISCLVVCRCRARRRWSTSRRRSSRDVLCRWTWSGEGLTWGLDWRTKRPGDQCWHLLPSSLKIETNPTPSNNTRNARYLINLSNSNWPLKHS